MILVQMHNATAVVFRRMARFVCMFVFVFFVRLPVLG